MKVDYENIVDKLLEMNPDPIPKFILLKEFKGYDQNSKEYQNAYDQVCEHPFVKKLEETQNERGFWPPFHGYTEGVIRRCLSFGLDNSHPSLVKVSEYLRKVLRNEESWDQFEKQDNPRWWPEIFVPIVSTAMLCLIDPDDEAVDVHRQQWTGFAEASLSGGIYDKDLDIKTKSNHFGFPFKHIMPPFHYYNLLLSVPNGNQKYLSNASDKALVDHYMNKIDGVGYVYNSSPDKFVQINVQNRDSRDFWHWIRALSLIAQFDRWSEYEEKYSEWILSQRNDDGLWEFPKKFDFVLSNSWRGKNKTIDSTIFVLRMLMKKKAF